MRRFLSKLALFILPFALGFTVLTGAMLYLGESLPLGLVIWMQQHDDQILYRPRYGNRDQQYKALAVQMRQPEVLALGSSRILQFRAGFFNRRPQDFYNAAAPAWGLDQMLRLLQSLDEQQYLPRVLLLAIDPPWFNPNYEQQSFPGDLSDFVNIFVVNRSFMQEIIGGVDLGRPGFDVAQYWQRPVLGSESGLALGMRAIRDGHGFRSDGSEQYGDFLIAQWLWQPQQRDNHLRMMRDGLDMYAYGDKVDEEAMQTLRTIFDFAAEHQITLIGFLPSYAPQLWDEMQQRGNHSYMHEVTTRTRALFDAYGFAFFDFSSGTWADTPDAEFYDGWHASELGNLRLYLRILQALPDVLGEYSDADVLEQIIAEASDPWQVFGLGSGAP